MDALCRITLMQPFRGDADAVVRLGDGQRSLAPMGAISVSDPNCQVGFNVHLGEVRNSGKNAQDIVYELRLGADNSIIIPIDCAQRHFGDWTVRPGDASQNAVKRTYGQEKARVAGNWGDYKRMPRGRQIAGAATAQADTRIIGAPEVPHVKIEVLEQNGKPYGEAFIPWDFYRWDADIDVAAVEEARRLYSVNAAAAPASPVLDVSALTPAQLDILAAALANRGGNGGRQKAHQQG